MSSGDNSQMKTQGKNQTNKPIAQLHQKKRVTFLKNNVLFEEHIKHT